MAWSFSPLALEEGLISVKKWERNCWQQWKGCEEVWFWGSVFYSGDGAVFGWDRRRWSAGTGGWGLCSCWTAAGGSRCCTVGLSLVHRRSCREDRLRLLVLRRSCREDRLRLLVLRSEEEQSAWDAAGTEITGLAGPRGRSYWCRAWSRGRWSWWRVMVMENEKLLEEWMS